MAPKARKGKHVRGQGHHSTSSKPSSPTRAALGPATPAVSGAVGLLLGKLATAPHKPRTPQPAMCQGYSLEGHWLTPATGSCRNQV